MGLDMYFKRISCCQATKEMKNNEKLTLKGKGTEIEISAPKISRLIIEEDVAYWQKSKSNT